MNTHALGFVFAVFVLVLSTSLCGCGDAPSTPAAAPTSTKTLPDPRAPLIEKTQVADWCGEHGVPESICARCNAKLIPAFKAKGDWCEKHDLPDSQCFVCHPELEAQFKAKAPKDRR